MNHRANAQVTAAVLITTGRCLILFLKPHPSAHRPCETQRHTTELNFALSLKSWMRCMSDVFMHELQNLFRRKRVDYTRQLLQTHFHFTVELFCKRAFVEHIVSFIAQTLNLKASCGVYWSPDPVLFSLNWFMDSINGAQAAGVQVSVRTGLTGIHHSDQVLYSIFSCFSMQQDLCRCCWLSAQPDPGLVCMQTLTYTHAHTQIHLQRQ